MSCHSTPYHVSWYAALLTPSWPRFCGGSHVLTQNYQPGGACFVLVANAAFEARDRANTAKYCEKAKKNGISASERAVEYATGSTQDSTCAELGPSIAIEKGNTP